MRIRNLFIDYEFKKVFGFAIGYVEEQVVIILPFIVIYIS